MKNNNDTNQEKAQDEPVLPAAAAAATTLAPVLETTAAVSPTDTGYHTDPQQQQQQQQQRSSLSSSSSQLQHPISPPIEDDRYADYVLSDEEVLQLWDDDDDDDDDDEETVTTNNLLVRRRRPPIVDDDDDDDAIIIADDNDEPDNNNSNDGKTTSSSRTRRSKRRVQLEEEAEDAGDEADDESGDKPEKTPRPQHHRRSLVVGGKQEVEAAMMVDDKPWRSSGTGTATATSHRHHHHHHRRSSSGPIFRYIRSLAAGKRTHTNSSGGKTSKEGGISEDEEEMDGDDVDVDDDDVDDEDVTSSGSSIGGAAVADDDDAGASDDDSWDTDMVESDDEPFHAVDWGSMPLVPNSFLRTHRASHNNLLLLNISHHQPPALPYLDADMWQTPLTRADGDCFVWEHALLLQAVFQLLAEREQVGVEGSVDASDNIWKKGPLKKMSFAVGRRKMRPTAGAWVVKYVELRQGNLTYYQDSGDDHAGRKTIHLRQSEAVVQESSQRGPGFVFELLIQGSPAQYWAARSEEERQAWVRAIQSAMIGEEARRPRDLDLTPYEAAFKIYKNLRDAIKDVDLQELYMEAIQTAAMESDSIQIPVDWLREEVRAGAIAPLSTGDVSAKNTNTGTKRQLLKRKSSAHERLKFSIADFWRGMRQLSFSVNGYVVLRSTPVAAERVVGSLTRCILEYDKAAEPSSDDVNNETQNAISELQAVSFARAIFLSVLQGNEQRDMEIVVQDLLQGRPELMCVKSQSEDELDALTRLEVSFAGENFTDDFDEQDSEDLMSWIMLARRKSSNSSVPSSRWKRRYAVLSGAVLSFYEAASPRPHGLRLQLVLDAQTKINSAEMPKDLSNKSDSSILSDRRYVVIIKTQGSERLLSFDEEEDMMSWKDALQKIVELSVEASTDERTDRMPSTPAKMLVKGAERVIKTAADGGIRGGIRVIKGAKDSGMKAMKMATDSGMKAMKIATDGSMKMFRGTVGRLRPSSSRSPRRGGLDKPNINRVPSVQLLMDESKGSGKREPTVQCVVQRIRTFAIYAARAENTEEREDDHWMSVQVTWYQAFLMSGGPSGRMNSGDALVELDFVGKDDEEDDDEEWVGELDML